VGTIKEYDCLIATSERLDRDDDKEAHKCLLRAQDRVAVLGRVLTRFALLSATSFGIRDVIDVYSAVPGWSVGRATHDVHVLEASSSTINLEEVVKLHAPVVNGGLRRAGHYKRWW